MGALTYTLLDVAGKKKAFKVSFEACTREPLSWKEEVYAAAREIAKRTTKPIWVCSSGGIDSEVVCRAFFDQGINFSVLTLEHTAGTNQHDIHYAIAWCKERGVHQKIHAIDMDQFLGADTDRYGEKYVALHPFRYLQIRLMEIVEAMGGFAVLAGGEQLYSADIHKEVLTEDDVYLQFAIGNAVPLDWIKDTHTDHEPYFYFSTPELCLSFTRLPLVSFVLNNPETVLRHKSNAYTFKRVVYQSIWTDLKLRYKSDGLERIRPLVSDAILRMREAFGEKLLTYELPIPLFKQQLMRKLSAHEPQDR